MKKFLCSLFFLSWCFALQGQEEKTLGADASSIKKNSPTYRNDYWYVGAEFISPMLFDDWYSWTSGHFGFGKGASLKLGYRFSSAFGLELTGAWGTNRLRPNAYQHDYVLGMRDAYTYYPYTQIDGIEYTHPVVDLYGEQGANNRNGLVPPGVGFDKLVSRVSYKQLSAHAVFNLTHLIVPAAKYRQMPVEVYLNPGAYFTRFNSRVELLADSENRLTKEVVKAGTRVAPNVNRRLTYGLGANLMVRFNLGSHWAIDFSNHVVWERDRTMDGVRSIKTAYDAFLIAPGLGLTYKFRQKVPALATIAIQPGTPAPGLALPDLLYTLPEAPLQSKPKVREHTAMIYLTYPLNQTYIVEDLHENATELAKLNTEVKDYLTHKDYKVIDIRIEGFASPEGPYQNNMRLADGRAASLIDYIMERTALPGHMFTLGRTTENWSGLKKELETNERIAHRDELLKVYNAHVDTERRKRALIRTQGYDSLLAHVYPRLRLSSYTVSYEVRPYAVAEAKTLVKTAPTKLSPEEIYAVALDYGLLTPQGMQTLNTLYNTYPNEVTTLLIKGYTLLDEGKAAEAVELLKQLPMANSAVKNLLAVGYAKLGRLDAAIDLLRQAAMFNTDARHNLERLLQHRLATNP